MADTVYFLLILTVAVTHTTVAGDGDAAVAKPAAIANTNSLERGQI